MTDMVAPIVVVVVVDQAASAAGRPVRVRNTSSRVGRRRPTSSTSRRRPASSRTVVARPSGPRSTATVARRAGRSTRTLVVADAPQHRLDRAEVLGPADADLDDVAPGHALQLLGRAAGDRPAVVDDRDAIGQLVGLVEVLRGEQHVGAGAHQRRGWPATARCGCGDRGRSSARRAAAGGVRPRGWRRGRAGGACRPSSRGPSGRPPPRGRAGPAPRPPRPGPTGGRARTGGRPSPGSRARSWPARPPRTGRPARSRPAPARGWRAASMPATRRRPASGRSRVATARTRVDLPAPFGPSTAVTCPDGATRSSPASACDPLPSRAEAPW